MLEKSLYDSWKSRKWNCNMMNRPQKNDYCFVEKGHLFGFNHEDGGSNYLCCVENREKYTPVQVEATGDRETTGCYLLQLQRARVILPSSVLAKRKRDNMVSTIKTSEFKPLLTVISTLCNQAIDLVAYDSDCDELKLSQICSFMANLSRNGSDALTELDAASRKFNLLKKGFAGLGGRLKQLQHRHSRINRQQLKLHEVLSDIEDSHGPSDAMHDPLLTTQSQKDFVSKSHRDTTPSIDINSRSELVLM
ncbi:hypothetical protein Tco_0791311 [Tanacetum coccineum]